MQICLGVSSGEIREAARYGKPLARMVYRIGAGSSLLRQAAVREGRGGLLGLSDRAAPAVQDPEALAAAVLRECGRQHYGGILLDFEAAPRPDLEAFARVLREKTALPLYLPEPYLRAAPGALPLIGTAVSGGSFEDYLRTCAGRYGRHFALDAERLRMDFPLPSRSGLGTPLSAGALEALLEQKPAVFFSRELCARYFTCVRDGVTHFILYDDADTLARKLRLGASLGLPAAFLMWPEVRDLAPRLFGEGTKK